MATFENIRELIVSGDTDRAFKEMRALFSADKNKAEWLKTLQVVEGSFNRIRDNEIKNLIDRQEALKAYAGINNSLLELVAAAEEGRAPVVEGRNTGAARQALVWIAGGAITLLLGLLAGYLIKKGGDAAVETPAVQPAATVSAPECPEFDTAGTRVMIIPFVNEGEGASKPEVAIQTLIRNLTSKNMVKTDVELFAGNRFAQGPPDEQAAIKVGMECGADMVIWGTFEKQNQGISIDTRYVFTNAPNLPNGGIEGKFKSLTELKSDRGAYMTFEDAVFSLCTVMALHDGNMDLAKKWVEKIKNPTARDKKLMAMLTK